MKSKNNDSPICILNDGQYIFYYASFPETPKNRKILKPKNSPFDKTIQSYFYFEKLYYEGIYVDDNGCLCYSVPFCKNCNSFNVIKKDFNYRELNLADGSTKLVKMKRYLCKDCLTKSQTELLGLYEPYVRFSTPVIEMAENSLGYGYKSLRHLSNDLKLYCGVSISHETIRKYLLVDGNYYYKNIALKLSGYCSYDAQWVYIERKLYFRLVLFDIIMNMPIAECIVEKEDNKTIKEFINKSIPRNMRKAIVTDSKKGYDKVMKQLGFKYHQHCTFHLLKRIVDIIKKEIVVLLNKYKSEIKDENPKISKNRMKKLLDDERDRLWDVYQKYIDEIKDIFKQDNYNDAVAKINVIKSKINDFPDVIAVYLKNNFFPIYARYLVFLDNNVNGRLESTNNKVENYIGNILDKSKKKIFRTLRGLFSYIIHRKNGWISKMSESNNEII